MHKLQYFYLKEKALSVKLHFQNAYSQYKAVFLLFEGLSWSVLITSFWLKLCISVQQSVLKEWEVL